MRQATHLVLALLLVLQSSAQMIIVIKKPAEGGSPPAFVKQVQEWNYTDSAASETFNFAQNVAAGNFLVIHYENGTTFTNLITSVTDNGCGGTWVVVNDPTTASQGQGIAYTQCPNGATTSNQITLNWTGTNFNYKWGDLVEYSGIATSSPVDGSAAWKNDAFTGSAVTVPITTANASDLISCKVYTQAVIAYTVAGGFTESGTQALNGTHWYEYRVVSSTGTYDPAGTMASAGNYHGACIAFKGQ
jgi:hypothetical protein